MSEEPLKCPRRAEGTYPGAPKSDQWEERNGLPTCSWCGSVHPDKVLEVLEAGAKLTPTDKDYKAYLEGDGFKFAKVYFQHFSSDHQEKLIKMVNEGRVKFGAPGYFYVLPFFARRTSDPVA